MNLLSVQYKIHIPQSMETRLVSVATFIEPRKTFESKTFIQPQNLSNHIRTLLAAWRFDSEH